MQITHCDSLSAYVEFLQRDQDEPARLFRDLLINVTSFFRDAEAFNALEKSCSTSLSYGAVSLEEVVRQALAPYFSEDSQRLTLSGSSIRCRPRLR